MWIMGKRDESINAATGVIGGAGHSVKVGISMEREWGVYDQEHLNLEESIKTSVDPNPRFYQAPRGIKSLLRYPLIYF